MSISRKVFLRLILMSSNRFVSAPRFFRKGQILMRDSRDPRPVARKFGYGSILLATFLLAAAIPAISADDRKTETIDATAMGTSTQLGKTVSVKVIIYQFSTKEDRQVLVEAFKKGQNQGLVDALTKMKAVGRIAIT
jgi:hypothetical protein